VRTVDRVLAYLCAVTAVFSLAFAAGRLAGPMEPADHRPTPVTEHSGEH
jgi:hypothetical protein